MPAPGRQQLYDDFDLYHLDKDQEGPLLGALECSAVDDLAERVKFGCRPILLNNSKLIFNQNQKEEQLCPNT